MSGDYESRFSQIRDKLSGLRSALTDAPPAPPPPFGNWVVGTAPARIDLAGGWTDTPPICYEHGGAVVTAAVQLDGNRPIRTACRRLGDPNLRLVSVALDNGVKSTREMLLNEPKECIYWDPNAPCALLCAVLAALGLVDPESPRSLAEQLSQAWPTETSRGVGLEIRTEVDLPVGSGLGTSSILVATALAALSTLLGRSLTHDQLIHGTLYVEQLMSTGGGWQDQCGGIYPALKISRSPASLPVIVSTEQIDVAPEFLNNLSSRLCLIFTGQQRLARNLLRDVLTGFWEGKGPGDSESSVDGATYPANVGAALDQLIESAERSAVCLKFSDFEGLAKEVERYWSLKKYLANPPTAEPLPIRNLIARLKESELGFLAASCAGAGGGGFIYALSGSGGWDFDKVAAAVNEILPHARVYSASIDGEGLKVEVLDSLPE